MKGRVIVLGDGAIAAALVVDGQTEDWLPAAGDGVLSPGDIVATRVLRAVPGQGAAFVDLGGGRTGYLREAKGLKSAGIFPVQVSSIPEPGKAIPVDRRILIKGRRLILTPDRPGVNVSRQIRDVEERERLLGCLPDLGEEGGLIIRSAARHADAAEMRRELESLQASLAAIGTRAPAPGDVLVATHPHAFALREWTDPLPEMIAASKAVSRAVDDPWFWQCADLEDALSPGDGDPMDHFGVWDTLESLRAPLIDLPSGGTMSIEQTRAMVTVDVNTANAFDVNAGMTASLDAIRDLPRHLRLRGFGGQITIDFAPIKKMHRRKIEETLKAAFRRDPVDTSFAGWTPLGNFEMQRKRERHSPALD